MSVAEAFVRAPLRPTTVGALIVRDWYVLRSYRTAFVLDLVFGFLNLVVYHFISRALHPRVSGELSGVPSYFAFAAVGVSLTVVLQAAVTGLSQRIREEQLTGTLEALLVQPVSSLELALGVAGFPFLFAIVRAFLYLLLAGLLLGLSVARCNWGGLVVSMLVSGLVFGGIGILLAAIVIVMKRAQAVGSIGTFGLSLLGGAVFPIGALPPWLRPLGTIVPTRFAYEAVRGALFGMRGWVVPSLVLLGYAIVLLGLALALFTVALRRVIALGTINQY